MSNYRDGVHVATLAGIPVYVSPSFPVAAAFALSWALRASVTSELIVRLVVIFFGLWSILVHEFAHAGAARLLGVPVRHIALTGYGGYAAFWFDVASRWREAAIAFSGPAANLLLALLAWLALQFFGAQEPLQDSVHVQVVHQVFLFNLAVGLFNLLPGLPLDGGQIVRAGLSNWMSRSRAGWIAAWLGVAIGACVIVVAAANDNILTIAVGVFLIVVAWRDKRLMRYE